MESLEKLKERILESVEDNINNKKLLKELREEFIKKKLPSTIPNQLFSESIDEDHLDKNVLIAITKVFKNELDSEKFKLSNYFSEGEIFSYNNEIEVKEKIDYVLFKGIRQIDSKNFLGVIDGKQAVEMRKNSLYSYNKLFQRAPKLVKTSSGRIIKKIDANIDNILDMEKEFSEGKMIPTSIHFAILVNNTAGISENYKFKKMYENIGDMWIKPNFDFESETYLPLMCVDGWHRLTAMCNAVEKAETEGKAIKAELGCFVHIFDNEAEIRKFIIDTFKRCDTNLDYLNAITPNDENIFIDEFIKECKWLNGHTALTKQEMKLENNYTEQRILIDAFKKTNIEMNEDLKNTISRGKVAKVIDEILDYILKELYENNLEKMINSIYLNRNIFKMYIKFAAEVRDKKYGMDIYNLIQYIENNCEKITNTFNEKYIADSSIDLILSEVIK